MYLFKLNKLCHLSTLQIRTVKNFSAIPTDFLLNFFCLYILISRQLLFYQLYMLLVNLNYKLKDLKGNKLLFVAASLCYVIWSKIKLAEIMWYRTSVTVFTCAVNVCTWLSEKRQETFISFSPLTAIPHILFRTADTCTSHSLVCTISSTSVKGSFFCHSPQHTEGIWCLRYCLCTALSNFLFKEHVALLLPKTGQQSEIRQDKKWCTDVNQISQRRVNLFEWCAFKWFTCIQRTWRNVQKMLF